MPEDFGSISVALMSLFQIITLDNWSDLFNPAQSAAPIAAGVYFVSFILLGTMILLNLFIGIVMNSMAEMHAELNEQKQARHPVPALDHLAAIERQLAALRTTLGASHADRTPPAKPARKQPPPSGTMKSLFSGFPWKRRLIKTSGRT
jgi:voltage-gated sodium channel